MPGGRPASYLPIYATLAGRFARKGYTQEEIGKFLGVRRETVNRWAVAYPEFRHALKTTAANADDRVEQALYKNALRGQVAAQIFWLKNRRKEVWRDRYDVQTEGSYTPTFHDPTDRPAGYDRKRLPKMNGNGKAQT